MVAAYIQSVTCNLVRIALALIGKGGKVRVGYGVYRVKGWISLFPTFSDMGKNIIASRGVKLYVNIESIATGVFLFWNILCAALLLAMRANFVIKYTKIGSIASGETIQHAHVLFLRLRCSSYVV